MLYGRDVECAAVDQLLDDARRGRGGALVLTGDAGIGKTALLGYAAERAAGMQVLRAAGVQAEASIPFAGLYAVLRPALGGVAALPAPQATALGGALGLTETVEVPRFLVGAGALSVLAELAERQPVLCLLDDVQWIDGASLDALLFAARRIAADRIAVLFTARSGEVDLEAVPEVRLHSIDDDVAPQLLEGRGSALDESARSRVISLAAGNPLALVELSTELASTDDAWTAERAGLPLSERLEDAFLHRARDLSPDEGRLLLLAASEDSGDLRTLLTAAAHADIDTKSLDALERSRLLRVHDGLVELSHPLIRSAVYRRATFADRQQVHQVLAGVLAAEGQPERSLWHRAAAAVPPDEDVALELEQSAYAARARGAHATAATALDRAAALSATDEQRARRLLDAAEASWECGRTTEATALVEQARLVCSGPLLHGRADELRGRFEARGGVMLHGYEILMAAVDQLAGVDPLRAATAVVEATGAASYAGELDRVVEAGRRAEALGDEARSSPAAANAAGVAALLSGDPHRAAPLLQTAIDRGQGSDDPDSVLWAGVAAAYLGDSEAARRCAARTVSLARTAGALGTLATALELSEIVKLPLNPADAETDAEEGVRLARETGQPASMAIHLGTLATVAAIRGDEEAAAGHSEQVHVLAERHGLGYPRARADAALVLLDLGLGRPEAALERMEALVASAHRATVLGSTLDMVEAAVRAGAPERALAVAAGFEQWATAGGSSWSAGALARCRALLSEGDVATGHYEQAMSALSRYGWSFEGARTQLLFGEHLRRERRRVEARPHLRQAMETFERVGARPWADRAAAELRASGERARHRTPDEGRKLTAQERQIAVLVAEGASNKEVAARLYLSPRTVDAHLRSVFTKLGLSSRRQLHLEDLA